MPPAEIKPDHVWEPFRLLVCAKYPTHTLHELKEEIRERFGFQATEGQWKKRLGKWDLKKNDRLLYLCEVTSCCGQPVQGDGCFVHLKVGRDQGPAEPFDGNIIHNCRDETCEGPGLRKMNEEYLPYDRSEIPGKSTDTMTINTEATPDLTPGQTVCDFQWPNSLLTVAQPYSSGTTVLPFGPQTPAEAQSASDWHPPDPDFSPPAQVHKCIWDQSAALAHERPTEEPEEDPNFLFSEFLHDPPDHTRDR